MTMTIKKEGESYQEESSEKKVQEEVGEELQESSYEKELDGEQVGELHRGRLQGARWGASGRGCGGDGPNVSGEW